MRNYDHKEIEKKWQEEWGRSGIYKTDDTSAKPKWYSLVEFPYPSGDGLHTGHIRSYTAMDIISRKRRMEGFEVLYPCGWDAFGLPTENFAIKTGIHPIEVTKKNTDTFRRQLKEAGFSFDWSREINTSDPKYYKWTQWIFLQLFKKGLAYKTKTTISWCPSCKTGLANEEVVDGKCERCGTPVEKREKNQWMMAITKYAQRLYDDLDKVNYLDNIKISQRNWIGPSLGSDITFKLKNSDLTITVFTTRVDTLFGVTYMVLAPENELVQKLIDQVNNREEVEKYIKEASTKIETERVAEDREKTGVPLKGVFAINPANQEEVPVLVADYVLNSYGTGAVMAVPAHDDRDFAFAKKYNLPIKEVITGGNITEKAFCNYGTLANSGQFDGQGTEEAKKTITEFVGGKIITRFKLRDWVFSRQHYWGEPIPIIICDKCGYVPVEEKDLPVELPVVEKYRPNENGESPLADVVEWVKVKCPKCGGPAKRETDTMPNWAGSSWYFLRYIDPNNDQALADPAKLKKWLPVDWYNGGMEHTTLHLLYSRFWHKFLFDIGVVPTDEPYQKRTAQGMILGEGGIKMSKSKGNVVNPDGVIKNYGADTLRLYEMFMGPFDQSIPWSTESIIGSRRFLERVWRVYDRVTDKTEDDLDLIINQTINKIGADIEKMSFNTAVSTMMILVNEMEKKDKVSKKHFELFLILLSPFAPHITEELWAELGHKESIHLQFWPEVDQTKLVGQTAIIAIQINGRVRDTIEMPINSEENEVKTLALEREQVRKWVDNQPIKKVIFIKNKLLSLVI